MPNGEVASGQQHAWKLIQKLGEGDAGEVFLVESLVEKQPAILKRPRRSPFTSEMLRQASQIRLEGQVLDLLQRHRVRYKDYAIAAPGLIDQSKPGAEFSERFFIVIERAPGIDLAALAQAARLGALPDNASVVSGMDRHFYQALVSKGELADLLVLKILAGILEFLANIHQPDATLPDRQSRGVIWNDVKPSHLFWDVLEKTITVIDWGNAQLVQPDGASEDRRYTTKNDYAQFLQEMGSFLKELKPGLYQELEWPVEDIQVVKSLQTRIVRRLDQELARLRGFRQQEENLILKREPQLEEWQAIQTIQAQIIEMAELPDWPGAERLAIKLASRMINEGARQPFLDLCQQITRLPGINREHWEIVLVIARLVPWPGLFQIPVQQALLAAIEKDWPGALWQLRLAAGQTQLPDWWQSLCERIRKAQPEIGQEALAPLVVLNRLILTIFAWKDPHRNPNRRRSSSWLATYGRQSPAGGLSWSRIRQTRDWNIPKSSSSWKSSAF